jgi:hypothetical protein
MDLPIENQDERINHVVIASSRTGGTPRNDTFLLGLPVDFRFALCDLR